MSKRPKPRKVVFVKQMTMYAVTDPDDGRTLHVTECVVRVGCPICKSPAGTPCMGAYRYKQSTHYPRRNLFRDWVNGGRRHVHHPSVLYGLTSTWGDFPLRIVRGEIR